MERREQTSRAVRRNPIRACAVVAALAVVALLRAAPGQSDAASRADALRAVHDAERARQFGGDFGNWEAYPLLLGNEFQSDRKWSGMLLRFFVSSRFLGKVEASRILAR